MRVARVSETLAAAFAETRTGLGESGCLEGTKAMATASQGKTSEPMAGIVADVATKISGNALNGYLIVFSLEALMLVIAAIMLYRIDVQTFQRNVNEPSFVENVAVAAE